ncbi:MAG: phosphoglycerate mutase family protein [Parvularculaceae bacterium]
MTDLYILRHGNTFDKGDVVRRVGARTDMPLSVSGVMQATALAAHFERLGIEFSDVVSSPLERAMMTADIVAPDVFAEPRCLS